MLAPDGVTARNGDEVGDDARPRASVYGTDALGWALLKGRLSGRPGRTRCRGLYLVLLVFGSLDISTGGCLQRLEGTLLSVPNKGTDHGSGNRQVVQC